MGPLVCSCTSCTVRQGPCLTVTFFFPRAVPTLMVPVRFLPVVLGATRKVAVPGPEPEPMAIVIQDIAAPFGLAVQVHSPSVAITAILCSPPDAGTVSFVGERAVTFARRAVLVYGEVRAPKKTWALLGVALGFFSAVIFIVPLLLAYFTGGPSPSCRSPKWGIPA